MCDLPLLGTQMLVGTRKNKAPRLPPSCGESADLLEVFKVKDPNGQWRAKMYATSRALFESLTDRQLDGHLACLDANKKNGVVCMEAEVALLMTCASRKVPEWGRTLKRHQPTMDAANVELV